MSSKNAELTQTIARDVEQLLKVAANSAVVRASTLVASADGKVSAVVDVYADVPSDAPLQDVRAGSSAAWLAQTTPVLSSAVGTPVSVELVSASAEKTDSDGDSDDAACFIAGNCAASIAVIVVASLLVPIVIVVVVARRRKQGSSAAVSSDGERANFLANEFENHTFTSGPSHVDQEMEAPAARQYQQFRVDPFGARPRTLSTVNNKPSAAAAAAAVASPQLDLDDDDIDRYLQDLDLKFDMTNL